MDRMNRLDILKKNKSEPEKIPENTTQTTAPRQDKEYSKNTKRQDE